MSSQVFNNPCSFCKKSEYCKDKVMVKGLNKLIQEVAPKLVLGCKEHDCTLSNTPNWMVASELSLQEGVYC